MSWEEKKEKLFKVYDKEYNHARDKRKTEGFEIEGADVETVGG
jgi:hypothetical protein